MWLTFILSPSPFHISGQPSAHTSLSSMTSQQSSPSHPQASLWQALSHCRTWVLELPACRGWHWLVICCPFAFCDRCSTEYFENIPNLTGSYFMRNIIPNQDKNPESDTWSDICHSNKNPVTIVYQVRIASSSAPWEITAVPELPETARVVTIFIARQVVQRLSKLPMKIQPARQDRRRTLREMFRII